MKNLSKQMLLLMSCGLVLASCGGGEASQSESQDAPLSSLTSITESTNDSGEESVAASSSSEESSSKVDYTAGWTALPEMADAIKEYCGGNLIPFIDLQGDFHSVTVPKSETLAAHLTIYTTGSFDRTLVYNTNITYKKAGWDVYFDLDSLELTAEDTEDTGIYIHFYGKENTRDGGYIPYLEIYYQEPFKSPESGAWSVSTTAVLAEINCVKPHILPYCYLGKVNETATKTDTYTAQIKGGDWSIYESQIVASVKGSLSSGRNWTYTKGTKISAYGKYPSEVYTWKKSFSDGYTLSCKLYGATDGYYYSYSSAVAEVWAILEVTVTAPNK